MGKILSQSGISLAETYALDPPTTGPAEVNVREVHLVEEMGSRVHSERLNFFVGRASTGAVAASTAFAASLGDIPDSVNRVLGVAVIATAAGRISNCNVSILEAALSTPEEFVIWSWDETADLEIPIQHDDGGAGTTAQFLMRPRENYNLPSLIGRTGTDLLMPSLQFRGITNAVGTVTTRVFVYFARPDPVTPGTGEPSSRGLPLPGW